MECIIMFSLKFLHEKNIKSPKSQSKDYVSLHSGKKEWAAAFIIFILFVNIVLFL